MNFKKTNITDSETDKFLTQETNHISNLAKMLELGKKADYTVSNHEVQEVIYGIMGDLNPERKINQLGED